MHWVFTTLQITNKNCFGNLDALFNTSITFPTRHGVHIAWSLSVRSTYTSCMAQWKFEAKVNGEGFYFHSTDERKCFDLFSNAIKQISSTHLSILKKFPIKVTNIMLDCIYTHHTASPSIVYLVPLVQFVWVICDGGYGYGIKYK
jgi:hypothetical protein